MSAVLLKIIAKLAILSFIILGFSRIIALLTSPLCTKLMSTLDLPIASIMPELGFTTKQRGCVVRILNTMFLVGELFIISS